MIFEKIFENRKSDKVEYVCDTSVEYNENLQEQGLID